MAMELSDLSNTSTKQPVETYYELVKARFNERKLYQHNH